RAHDYTDNTHDDDLWRAFERIQRIEQCLTELTRRIATVENALACPNGAERARPLIKDSRHLLHGTRYAISPNEPGEHAGTETNDEHAKIDNRENCDGPRNTRR